MTQGSTQNYNLALYSWDGDEWLIPATSVNPQSGLPGQLPFEEIWFTPSVSEWYYVVIYDDGTTAPRFLSLRSFSCQFQYFDPGYSVYTPESVDSVNAGAAFWNDLGLEPFSSQGPLFGPGGVPDGALAPQLVGADGVSGVTHGPSNGVPWASGGTGFRGTSAAYPHVAGGAALVLSANPGLTVVQLESLLFADGFESGDTAAWSATVP